MSIVDPSTTIAALLYFYNMPSLTKYQSILLLLFFLILNEWFYTETIRLKTVDACNCSVFKFLENKFYFLCEKSKNYTHLYEQ